jgi:hypothetical protein
MPVAYEELEGSPRLRINDAGVSAVRVFRVAWADWPAFARSLIGHYQLIGGALHYVPALPFPGLLNLIADELAIEPFDPRNPSGDVSQTLDGATNAYSGGARVTATYRTLRDRDNRSRDDLPSVPEGTFLRFRSEVAAEYYSTPGRVWSWDIAGAPKVSEDVMPGILLPSGGYELIWQRVAYPPWDAMRALRGKLNQSTFLGSPAGTVLFTGARATREFQFLEDGGLWRIEYQFLEQTKELNSGTKVGWNYFYREQASAGEHWLRIKDATGDPPYLSGDFSALFVFET